MNTWDLMGLFYKLADGVAWNPAERIATFKSQESAKSQKAFKEIEDKADWEDIARLQKDGEIPKFKLKQTDPNFKDDQAAQLIEKVLDYKDEENRKYLEAYQKGRPYRHIGFEEAYIKYARANPEVKKSPEQTKEDTDRKKVAERTRSTNGESSHKTEQPFVARSKRDLDNFIDNLEF